MKQKPLLIIWAVLFILCAGLGFIPEPEGTAAAFMTAAALGFFLPPGLLLYRAHREKDRHTISLIRNLSALSLVLTSVMLVLNFLCVLGSQTLGNILHTMLVIVSSPMVCSGYWALSLFLWACLLSAAIKLLKNQ